MKILKYKKRRENYMTESELFGLFAKYAKYEFGSYYIQFNSKLLSGNSPAQLYSLLKKEIKNVQKNK